jgi:hypothetical protein
MYRFLLISMLFWSIPFTGTARADSSSSVDKSHFATEGVRWNKFVDDLYALHKKHIAGKDIQIVERVSGYFRYENFYKEQKFIDKKTGKTASLIQWETKNPKNIHVIHVFFRDDKGRLIRDFSATYRTDDHDDPMTTEINLHAYSGGLEAFRQFNASGEITYERCRGSRKGKKVDIRLGILELEEYRGEPDTVMTTPAYKACFGSIPLKPGKYLTPQ